MFQSGEVVTYLDMCREEGIQLQRGMNFRIRGGRSVVLMSRRRNAPYVDRVEDDGKSIIYEGHDTPRSSSVADPKLVDQPAVLPTGRPTQNGTFEQAARDFKRGRREPEVVYVYEKIHMGVWAFNGIFRLTDAWMETDRARRVFKFRLEITTDAMDPINGRTGTEHSRVIPSEVKAEVWARDGGACVQCGATDNLHFDHVLPFSKGGTSLVAANIQLLCARHNLAKRDRIE